MRKSSLLVTTVIFSLLLIMFACRRDIDNFVRDQAVPSNMLESAKIYHAKKAKTFPDQNGVSFIKLKPLWKDAWTVKTREGRILAVPTIENRIENVNFQVRRVFLFSETNGQISNGVIVEFVGEKYNVEDNLNNLIAAYKQNSIPGFNGSIIQYDINYFNTRSAVFESGRKTDKKSQLIRDSSRKIKLSRMQRLMGVKGSSSNKTSYVDPNYVFNPNCMYRINTAWICYGGLCELKITSIEELTCSDPPGTGSGFGSGSNGNGSGTTSNNSGNGGGGTGGGSYGGNEPLEVKNEIEDECLANSVELALNAKNTIRDMMNSLTGNLTMSDMKIVFRESATMNGSLSGEAQFYPNESVDTITLNKPFLKGRSIEYQVATIYHEVLHAYMDIYNYKNANGEYDPPTSHQGMVDSYLSLMVGGLRIAFPHLSLEDAYALTMDGLKETTIWNTLLTEKQRTDIDAILFKYQIDAPSNKRRGTYCE